MAELNVAVAIGAQDVGATSTLTKVAASLGEVQSAALRAADAVGDSGSGFTVKVLGMAEASKKAAGAHAEHATALSGLKDWFADSAREALAFGTALVGVQLGESILSNLGAALVEIPERLERSRISFETFTGSAKLAADLVAQMQELGKIDPFRTTALLDVATRLVALGTPAEQTAQRVQDIATAVAAVGGSDEDLQRIAVSLARLQETGTLTSRTMLQLVNEQIPAWQILEVGLGKTQTQLEGMLKAGEITSDVFNQAFHTWATSGDVADVLGKRAGTAAGSMVVLSNALQQASVEAVQPFTKDINTGAEALARFAESGTLTRWAAAFREQVGEAAAGLKPFLDAIESVNKFMSTPLRYVPPPVVPGVTGGGPLTATDQRAKIANQDSIEQLLRLDQSLQQTYAESHNLDGALVEVHGQLESMANASVSAKASLVGVTDAVIDANAPMTRLSDAYEGQTLDAVRLVAANSALLDSYGKVGQAAIAAAQAQTAARAALHDTVAALQAQADPSTNSAYVTISPTDALIEAQKDLDAQAKKTAASLASIGQNALAALPGLSALDLAIAGTQSKLAGVQLQIEEKVLTRMERRPATSLGAQEALLQEQLKIEQLQKAAGYSVPMEQLKISNANTAAANSAASHAAHASRSAGGSTHQVFYPGTPSAAPQVSVNVDQVVTEADAHAVGQAVTNHLIALTKGGGSTPGRANVQLAGVR